MTSAANQLLNLGQGDYRVQYRTFIKLILTACLLICSAVAVHSIQQQGGPSITGFSPTSGGVGTTVTITGTNLTGASAVRFGGVPCTNFIVNSSTQVTAVVPAGAVSGPIAIDIPAPGAKPITPNAVFTATSAQSFTVVPPPTVTSFTPIQGSAGTAVTVTGTGFVGASGVTFGGVTAPGFIIVSDTSITVNVPAGAVTGPISVTSVGGTGVSATPFTILNPPTITSFTPTTGPVGTPVTITGTRFTGATRVTFGGVAAAVFNVVNDQTINATVPAAAASGPIGVTTAGGTATSTQIFTIPGTPSITSFTPVQGAVGTVVSITGTTLTGVTGTTFGGVAATAFTVVSDTTITATVPNGAVSGPIGVSGSRGSALSTMSFTVIVPPRIDSFTPTTGGSGTVVTVTGSGFSGTTGVTVGGVAVTDFTVLTDGSLSFTATQSGVITVTTPNGAATSGTPFTLTTATVTTLSGTVLSASPLNATPDPGGAANVGSLVVQNTGNTSQTLQSLTISLSTPRLVASGTASVTAGGVSATATATPSGDTLVFQFAQPVVLQAGQSANIAVVLTAASSLTAMNATLAIALSGVLLGLAPRRAMRGLLTLAAVVCLTAGLAGCGGGARGNGGAADPNIFNTTPPPTTVSTTVTVTAVSASGPNGEAIAYSGVPVRLGSVSLTIRR